MTKEEQVQYLANIYHVARASGRVEVIEDSVAEDMAKGIALAMERGRRGKIYNLGNPNNRCTINELADTVIAITGSCAGKVYVDPKKLYGPHYEEANNKFPDSTQAMDELGWRPVYSKEATIQQAVDYFLKLPPHLQSHLSGIRTESDVDSFRRRSVSAMK